MNINGLKQYVENAIGQYQSGWRWRPEDIGPDADAASLDFLSSILGLPETIQRNQMGELNTRIPSEHKRSSRYLRALKKSTRIDSNTGVFTIPSDYLYDESVHGIDLVSINNDEKQRKLQYHGYPGQEITNSSGEVTHIIYRIPVREVDTDKQHSILNSKRHKPSPIFPKMVFKSDGIYVYPRTIKSIFIDYIKMPTIPVWGYNTVNGAPVYDPAQSTDLDWDEELRTEIGGRIIRRIGVKLRDQTLAQFGQTTIQQGE